MNVLFNPLNLLVLCLQLFTLQWGLKQFMTYLLNYNLFLFNYIYCSVLSFSIQTTCPFLCLLFDLTHRESCTRIPMHHSSIPVFLLYVSVGLYTNSKSLKALICLDLLHMTYLSVCLSVYPASQPASQPHICVSHNSTKNVL